MRLKFMKFCFQIFLSVIIISCKDSVKTTINKTQNLDSITEYLTLINNKSFPLKEKDSITHILYKKALLKNDSTLINSVLFQLVKNAYSLNEKDSLLKYFPIAINYATTLNDTKTKAEIYNYLGFYYSKNHQLDSAYYCYYHSNKGFKELKDTLAIGKSYINLAIIQKNIGDYIGSEQTSINALIYLEPIKNLRYSASIYNNLGIISKELKKHSNSIEYHQKALELRNKLPNSPLLAIQSMNNLAVAYKNNGNYKTAINILDSLNTISLTIPNKIKAGTLDNLAHSKLLANTKTNEILNELNAALSIRINENDLDGMVISYIHIGDYYIFKKNENKAIENYNKAIILAKKTKNFRDILSSLKKLSLISTNTNSLTHLNNYYTLTDSLEIEKNKVSDHFARIRFESDSKETENLQLKIETAQQTQQIEKEKTQKWVLGGGLGTSIITLFIFGYYYQKNKKQKLLIESLQKELHHRVKNNLGIIDTFIEVAKEEFADKPFEHKLTELQHRVSSINQVHKQLYSTKDLASLDVKNYVQELVTNIENSFANKHIKVVQHIPENLTIATENSFPLGLIINEFLTNSFKYAFENSEKGSIEITITNTNNKFILNLQDNGKGLPNSFNLEKTTTFGIRIMKLLSKQLNGTFELNSNNGVQLIIKFKH